LFGGKEDSRFRGNDDGGAWNTCHAETRSGESVSVIFEDPERSGLFGREHRKLQKAR
jgi:hypothetical protein